MIRRLLGLGLAGWGGWCLWNSYKAINSYVSRGADLNTTLMEPEFLLPGVGHGLLCLGGLMVLGAVPLGGVLSLLGVVLVTFFASVIMIMGADSSLWLDKMIVSAFLFIVVVAVLRLKRKN